MSTITKPSRDNLEAYVAKALGDSDDIEGVLKKEEATHGDGDGMVSRKEAQALLDRAKVTNGDDRNTLLKGMGLQAPSSKVSIGDLLNKLAEAVYASQIS